MISHFNYYEGGNLVSTVAYNLSGRPASVAGEDLVAGTPAGTIGMLSDP